MKNKIIFIDSPPVGNTYANPGSTYPANSVLMLGSYLKKHGYEIMIIDGRNYPDYLDILKREIKSDRQQIVYVGVTVMTIAVPSALDISRAVKKLAPEIPVIWGGAHPTLFPESTLDDPSVDMIAMNEATHSALRVANALTEGLRVSDVNGIGYKDESSRAILNLPAEADDFDELPFFDFSLIDIDLYMKPRGLSVYAREFPNFKGEIRPVPLLTGLGCPFKCEFCINVILQRKYRFRPAPAIISEIKRLQDEYGANTFIFMDEEFFVSKKRVREFFEQANEEKLKFNWRMWCRVDRFKESYLNRDMLALMNNVGHGSLVMGGESGNQEMLDHLNKGTRTEQVYSSLDSLKEFTNITPRYSFMVGMEGETMAQIRDTYDMCLKMKKKRPNADIAGPYDFRLYPGSPIFKRLVEKYELEIPERLEDWEGFLERDEMSTFTEMPWAPKEFLDKRKYIHFYQQYAMNRPMRRNSLGRMAAEILGRSSALRMRRFFFRFPVEYWLINARRHMMQ